MSQDLASFIMPPLIKAFARTRLPKLDGDLKLGGLNGPVEVLRDEWGVPHIYAGDNHDLFFAQGYVHAQDRFWQLEFSRRLIAGRLSEILGRLTLPLDRWMRTLTMRNVAEFEAGLLDTQKDPDLQAYADGINAYLAKGKMPVEIVLLRYRPEPWTPADTLSWVKMMGWTLSVNWEAELLRARLIARLGPEKAAELEPPHLSRWPLVIPPDVDFSQLDLSVLDRAYKVRPFAGPSPYDGLGSNNWVISGELSETGKPLLANDMHLGLTVPSIWYENHLTAPEFSVTGVTFPGVPGVVAGHNGKVAWSFTNGFPDVQDLYLERLRRQPDGTVEAEYNGEWEKTRQLHEEISIKGEKPDTLEVVVTRHGPVINELAPVLCGDQSLALRWTALEPDNLIRCVFDFAKSKNCRDFHQALRNWTTPSQNIVYADVEDNIGYTLAGRIPLRAKGKGRVPVPGWNDEYEWVSYIPFETLPHLENPPQGYIVSANNRVVDAEYPVTLELEPISGDRAQRISEMLLDPVLRQEKEKLGKDDFIRMQFDQCSPSARVIARQLGSLPNKNSAHHHETQVQAVVKLMRSWDGDLSPDNAAAAIYQVCIRKLIWLMMKEKIDPSMGNDRLTSDGKPDGSGDKDPSIALTSYFLGEGPTPVLAETSLIGSRWLDWLTNEIKLPDSPWFDLGRGENRDECLRIALDQTIEELTSRFGKDMNRWKWGAIHQLTFNHNLSTNPTLGAVFNVGPYQIGGDHTTVWATGTSYHNLDTSQMIGPPYRMIVDLSDIKQSISVLAPGQSGNPASAHYRDQVKDWFEGRYHPMLFERRDVLARTKHHLRLNPG